MTTIRFEQDGAIGSVLLINPPSNSSSPRSRNRDMTATSVAG